MRYIYNSALYIYSSNLQLRFWFNRLHSVLHHHGGTCQSVGMATSNHTALLCRHVLHSAAVGELQPRASDLRSLDDFIKFLAGEASELAKVDTQAASEKCFSSAIKADTDEVYVQLVVDYTDPPPLEWSSKPAGQ